MLTMLVMNLSCGTVGTAVRVSNRPTPAVDSQD